MPIYRYRAITENGMIVTNTIEESSRYLAIKTLKRNNLVPINIQKSLQRKKASKTKRKNARGVEDILKDVDTTNILQNRTKAKLSFFDKIYLNITKTEKVTSRDIIVFTQNFYLLKKANFNNIHALNTIIEGTENFTFRGILEDIVARSRSRRKHVFDYGILRRRISVYLYKHDKSRRIIRKSDDFIRASC